MFICSIKEQLTPLQVRPPATFPVVASTPASYEGVARDCLLYTPQQQDG